MQNLGEYSLALIAQGSHFEVKGSVELGSGGGHFTVQ